MRILKENSVGLVIDIQERLFPHIFKNDELSQKAKILIEGLQALDIPLLVTQQYTKALGETIEPLKEIITKTSDKVIEKTAFSCCDEPNFMQELEKTEKKNVIITGMEAHICVTQTAIDLIEKGFQPIIVADCVSSRQEQDKLLGLQRMRAEGAIITSYEAILFELCRTAKAPEFKTISKLVK